MRLTLDCNVLIGACYIDGVCRRVIHAAVAAHAIVLSTPILAEYHRVIARPKHARRRREVLVGLCEVIERVAVLVVPREVSFGLVDPSDEVCLATAVAGSAELLVTGNSRHFTAAAYGAVRVVSPAAAIQVLGRPPESLTGD